MKTDLAQLLILAANTREQSFVSLPTETPFWKFGADKSHYEKSLGEACKEAVASHADYEGLGVVAYLLLNSNWNESLEWANQTLKEAVN